jgi:hypothetical protein
MMVEEDLDVSVLTSSKHDEGPGVRPALIVAEVRCRRGDIHRVHPSIVLYPGDGLEIDDRIHGHSFSFKIEEG